jgi:protein SCO1/2
MRRRTRVLGSGHGLHLAVLIASLVCLPAPGHVASAEADHSHHHQLMKESALVRSTSAYPVPEVDLVDQDAEQVALRALLDADKPVLLNFIFASCTTICPVLSAGFAGFQKQLGDDADEVLFVSVTIDPEHDTAETLKKYAERVGARPGWVFLTGRREDVDRVAKAFGAYVANKMDHRPATYLRAPASDTWVKIDGFMGASDYTTEYAQLIDD